MATTDNLFCDLREDVQLPTMAWAWDEEWHIDQVCKK